MRLVRYRHGDRVGVGVLDPDGVRPTGHDDLRDFIEAGGPRGESDPIRPDGLLAPVADRAQLLFAGGNYADHRAEAGLFAKDPVFFAKLPSSVIGPQDAIRIPDRATETDWEAELAVVIGRTARRLTVDNAMDHVFGYTLVNDVSARDVMAAEPLQVTLAKSPDTFCPLGPHVVTRDELPDLSSLRISSTLNGVPKQDAPLSSMIHGVPELLAFLTRTVTLRPGDVVTTGTPGGTGFRRTPPEFLRPGDKITVAVTGIGELTNTVVAGWS